MANSDEKQLAEPRRGQLHRSGELHIAVAVDEIDLQLAVRCTGHRIRRTVRRRNDGSRGPSASRERNRARVALHDRPAVIVVDEVSVRSGDGSASHVRLRRPILRPRRPARADELTVDDPLEAVAGDRRGGVRTVGEQDVGAPRASFLREVTRSPGSPAVPDGEKVFSVRCNGRRASSHRPDHRALRRNLDLARVNGRSEDQKKEDPTDRNHGREDTHAAEGMSMVIVRTPRPTRSLADARDDEPRTRLVTSNRA